MWFHYLKSSAFHFDSHCVALARDMINSKPWLKVLYSRTVRLCQVGGLDCVYISGRFSFCLHGIPCPSNSKERSPRVHLCRHSVPRTHAETTSSPPASLQATLQYLSNMLGGTETTSCSFSPPYDRFIHSSIHSRILKAHAWHSDAL